MCASEKKFGEEIPIPSFQTSSQTAKLRERVGEYAIVSAPLSFLFQRFDAKLLMNRYQNLWLPLVADSLKFDSLLNFDSKGKILLPPLDVQWVWHCHCLNPVSCNLLLTCATPCSPEHFLSPP